MQRQQLHIQDRIMEIGNAGSHRETDKPITRFMKPTFG